jgi:fluoride ion exporter CrcB/FEX
MGANAHWPAMTRDLGRSGDTTSSTFTVKTVELVENGAWRYAGWDLALSGPLGSTGALVVFLAVR